VSKRLLGIGECMVELFPESPGLWRQGFAGDVFNTLWYARAYLGGDDAVDFHTGLGRDRLSDVFGIFLREHGIDIGDSPRFDDRTLGLYSIHLDDNGERSFTYWRDTSAARRLAADGERLAGRVAAADLVYLSGITLAILPPDDLDTLHAVLVDARGECTIAFDPNIRPHLWRDDSRMRSNIQRFSALAHIVLPGVEDEALCFGPGSGDDVARRYIDFGATRVIVKEGGKRVLVRGDLDLELKLDAIPEPLDTTGAGDAFAGALLAGVLDGLETEVSLRRAHACAAKVVMTAGALCPFEHLPHLPASRRD